MAEDPQTEIRGGGDPLAAMYFVAAVLMGLGAVAVVLFLFLPRDLFTRTSEDAIIPGTSQYVAPDGGQPRVETAAERAVRDSLHDH